MSAAAAVVAPCLLFVAGMIYTYTLPETNIAPEKWMFGTLASFWEGLFSGVMSVSGNVIIIYYNHHQTS